MTLVDPCPETVWNLKPNPITSVNHYLRDALKERVWVIDEFAEVFSQVDCGPLRVIFINADAGTTALDPLLFNDF